MDKIVEEAKHKIKKNKISYFNFIIGLVLIIILGFISVFFVTKKTKEDVENSMFSYTGIFLASIKPQDFEKLSNTKEDLTNPTFIELSERLEDIWEPSKDAGVRWSYTLFPSGNDLVFGPDSTPPGEFGYVEPGYKYEINDASLEKTLKEDVLQNGTKSISSPYQDEWGVWISFLCPIKDSNGNTIGIFATDIEYEKYKSLIKERQFFVIMFFVFAIILYSIIFFYLENITKVRVLLEKSEFEYSEKSFEENRQKKLQEVRQKMLGN